MFYLENSYAPAPKKYMKHSGSDLINNIPGQIIFPRHSGCDIFLKEPVAEVV